MVIYGNTAEDLGQFNIEVDLDSSLTDTVSAVEGNLEDLPPAFHSNMLTIKELVSTMKIFSQALFELDVPLELRKYIKLVLKILDAQIPAAADKSISSLVSVISNYVAPCLSRGIKSKLWEINGLINGGGANQAFTEAEKELLDLYKRHQNQSWYPSAESSGECSFNEFEEGVPSSKELMDILHQHFDFHISADIVGYQHLSLVGGICSLCEILVAVWIFFEILLILLFLFLIIISCKPM